MWETPNKKQQHQVIPGLYVGKLGNAKKRATPRRHRVRMAWIPYLTPSATCHLQHVRKGRMLTY